MPHLDHTGPDGKGPKTGRKLGLCRKTESDFNESGIAGKGRGLRKHSGGGRGKGKRIKYDTNN